MFFHIEQKSSLYITVKDNKINNFRSFTKSLILYSRIEISEQIRQIFQRFKTASLSDNEILVRSRFFVFYC
jgi:hypothetical protein